MNGILKSGAMIARFVAACWLICVVVGILPDPGFDLVALCVALILLMLQEGVGR